jgi:hypothetical protein
MRGSPKECSLGRRNGEIERLRPAEKRAKSESLIESRCAVVLGIYEKRIYRWRSLYGTLCRISQERRAQAAALKLVIDCQSPDQNGRQRRVAGQTLRILRRKVDQGNAGCRNGVIGRYCICRSLDSHEAVSNASANVLGCLRLKITVQCFFAARKLLTVMFVTESLDPERDGGHSVPSNSRRRLKAFLSAGVGAGGFRIAAAT